MNLPYKTTVQKRYIMKIKSDSKIGGYFWIFKSHLYFKATLFDCLTYCLIKRQNYSTGGKK